MRVDGLVREEGRTFLVMEYLAGGDLGQFRGRSFETWAAAVDGVAAALEALHARGLVHRDLKCSNVFLDDAGRPKLGDFGLAALAGSAADGGSPYNASPQQLRGEPAAAADDLYALGALLYELIADHPPYYPDITRDRVLLEPVPPLVPRGEVPVAVRELTLRLLAKSPGDRPASAREVRRALAAPEFGRRGRDADHARVAGRGPRRVSAHAAAADSARHRGRGARRHRRIRLAAVAARRRGIRARRRCPPAGGGGRCNASD